MPAPAETVDEYLAGLPADQRAVLQELRETILAAVPQARELISYRMPLYKHHGDLVAFGGFQHHCSFFVMSSELPRRFAEALKDYDIRHTTIHFSSEQPLPAQLVRAIVEARVEENESRAAGGPGRR